MAKEIIIEIGENGEIELRAEGYKGKQCKADSKDIEEALGISDGKRKTLPEYHLTEVVKQKQKA